MYARTLTYTHICVCMHRCPSTMHKHMYLNSCTHTCLHTQARNYVYRIHMHTLCTHIPVPKGPQRSTLTHTHWHPHAHTHTDPCTYFQGCARTHTHTHLHIGTRVSSSHGRLGVGTRGLSGQAELDRCLPRHPGGYSKGEKAVG